MNSPHVHQSCAERLAASQEAIRQWDAFVGLDGFVDEIIHVVDKRENAESFTRLPTIASFAERLAGAAGRSTNIELVNQLTKIGGNGPIMANALATFGLKVTYVGNLGYPQLHPVFQSFAERAEVHSIAEACHTDALEFEDGKVMFGKSTQLREINWENIQARYGREAFAKKFNSAHLVAFVNWTMIPFMSELWEALLKELCPSLTGPRRHIFFDLADPEKRSAADIRRALELITAFAEYFDVTLGLNEKEAYEIAEVFGLKTGEHTSDGLIELAFEIHRRVPVQTLAIHPVTYALAVSQGKVDLVQGPFIAKPKITTGAGDHFNAGFCLGKLLDLDNACSLLTGVASSGFYVRTAKSPNLNDLESMIRNWPAR
ncbi:MAG: PfkB family carbohydrate kinase [Verrucomicrobiota bacterium]